MAIGLVADEGSVYIKKEVTEGTYVAEAAGADAVEVLADGLEFTPTKELLERNNRTSTVENVPARVGQKSMAASVPVEFKAGNAEGAAPETSPLWEALLGGVDTLTEVTSLVDHTTAKIYLTSTAQYKVGHIVKVKQSEIAGEDHVSPIKAIGSDVGGNFIELVVPYGVAFSDNVKIGAAVNYFHQSGAPTLSLTNYLGGKIREKAIGMRAVSAEIANFSTGQLPTATFNLEGLDFDREVGEPLFAPVYDTSLPPVVLCSKVYKDGTEITVNAVTLSLTNTLGFLTSTASCSGKIRSRITDFAVNFTINPYMEDDDTDLFDIFKDNTGFSLFGSSNNKTDTAGEKAEVVAFYMPNCRIPEITSGVEDGILTDAINGQAYKTSGNDTVFIAFL
jgi:hypothetical protein